MLAVHKVYNTMSNFNQNGKDTPTTTIGRKKRRMRRLKSGNSSQNALNGRPLTSHNIILKGAAGLNQQF